MAKFHVWLESDVHRTLIINNDLSGDKDYRVEIEYEKSSDGSDTHYILIEPQLNKSDSLRINLGGIKIPPQVDD
jgi:hypothetical protein